MPPLSKHRLRPCLHGSLPEFYSKILVKLWFFFFFDQSQTVVITKDFRVSLVLEDLPGSHLVKIKN